MAINFKISIRRDNDCLHLKLNGHFDGSSAYELIHLIKKLCRSSCKVYIDTGRLKQIYPFGRSTFQSNLYLLVGQGISIVFVGENARQMLPEHGRSYENLRVSMI